KRHALTVPLEAFVMCLFRPVPISLLLDQNSLVLGHCQQS
ncbi:DUF1196 domain-containing protein, partial [Vibrio cholerae]|nr:DUF1196 domain-containing protein [Vibrio cholerae]